MPRCLIAAVFQALAVGAFALHAGAQTYTSNTPFVIQSDSTATGGRATPYPSTITVTDGPASIGDITIGLINLRHDRAKELVIGLLGPQNNFFVLLDACCGENSIAGTTIAFNQNAPNQVPMGPSIPPGTYYPTSSSFGAIPGVPVNPALYYTDLGPLPGTNANGSWSLYVYDSNPASGGGALDGWFIVFNGRTQYSFTYQGVLDQNGAPLTGDANVRFSLYSGPVFSGPVQPLAGPIIRSFTGLERGVCSTVLDFGDAIQTPGELALGIEVESPPGSGYQALSPLTPLTIVPIAGRSLTADNALKADRATKADTASFATNANFATTASIANSAYTANTAFVANNVPWSGITNVPPSVTVPPRVFSFANSSASFSIVPVVETQLSNTVQSTNDFQAGVAVVDFAMSCFTSSANTGFQFRFRIGNTFSAPVNFFFNQAGVHQSFSGKVTIAVPAGFQQCSLYVTRTAGAGGLFVDTNDTVTYTILNLRQ